VDHDEADHLRWENRQLRRALSRWRVVSLVACALGAALAVVGLGAIRTAHFVVERQRVAGFNAELERVARDDGLRDSLWLALREEREARRKAESPFRSARGALAGGVGLAALESADDGP
jgi:sugar phosphate isomerase/epimerase